LRASRVSPGDALKASGRTLAGSRPQSRLRRGLVALQITLSLVLLAGGLLFGRSLVNLLTVDTGFRSDGILEADVDIGRLALSPEARAALRRDLLERLRALPDVEAVATATTVPMVGIWYRHVYVDGPSGAARHQSRFNRVSDGFFRTLDTPFVSGRDFDARDTPTSPLVMIVNEEFVARCFGGRSPLEAIVRLEGPKAQPGTPVTIVGVVRNAKQGSLREEFPPIAYLADSQVSQQDTFFQFFIRGRSRAAPLKPAVSLAIAAVNAGAFFHFHDFQEQVRYTVQLDRLMATLCGFFAILGVVLASIGVYGVTTHSVNQRTTEFGVRLTLGATPHAIVRMILRESTIVIAIGLLAGAILASVSARAAEGLVFGLAPGDPATVGLAASLLVIIAVASALTPAIRASRIDPIRALRDE
jgi:predicted permease